MEYFNHPISRRILLCFAIALGLDLVTRIFIAPQTQLQQNSESPAASPSQFTASDSSVSDLGSPSESSFVNSPGPNGDGSFVKSTEQIFIQVRLCHSCGYSKKYDEIKNYLMNYYPNATFIATEYPLSIARTLLGYILRLVQVVLGATMLFGDKIFAYLKMTPPPIYHKLLEKKMMVMFAIIFLGNNIHSAIVSTGAFEVYLGNSLLYSKKATGSFPEPEFLLHKLVELVK